jgi:hypothetical protein
MMVSFSKPNSQYFQESATSKVQVTFEQFSGFCFQSQFHVFGRNNIISAKRLIFNGNRQKRMVFKVFGRNNLLSDESVLSEFHQSEKMKRHVISFHFTPNRINMLSSEYISHNSSNGWTYMSSVIEISKHLYY